MTPTRGRRNGIDASSTAPRPALRRIPSTKKSRACPEDAAMATATPTAISPLNACCTLSRRTRRSTKTTSAAPTAAQMPVRRPPSELATMKAIVGRLASTMPRQPPSCSMTRWRSNVRGAACAPVGSGAAGAGPSGRSPGALIAVSPGTSVAGASPLALSTSSDGSAGAEFVPGVVDDPLAVEGGEPAAGSEGAAGLDAGDTPPAEPDQGDRPGTVEEFGLQSGNGLARGVDHRLQAAGHGDDGALAARDQGLAAGAGRLGAELLRIDGLVIGGEPLQGARQPAGRSGLRHVPSSLAPAGQVPTRHASRVTVRARSRTPAYGPDCHRGGAARRGRGHPAPTVTRPAAPPAGRRGSGQPPPAAGPAARPPAGAAWGAVAPARASAHLREP